MTATLPSSEPTLGQQRPWTLIESHDATITLEHGEKSDHATLLDACVAFANSTAPYKQVLYDDDELVRELHPFEERTLEMICHWHGLDVENVG